MRWMVVVLTVAGVTACALFVPTRRFVNVIWSWSHFPATALIAGPHETEFLRDDEITWCWVNDLAIEEEDPFDNDFLVAIQYRGAPPGTPARSGYEVQWEIVIAEQALILLLGGGLLTWVVRRERRRTAAA